MGVLYYLALVLGLFGGCWAMVGEHTARWLFVTVHLSCAAAVLLLYIRELLFRHLAEAQNVETSSSQELHS